MALKIRFDIAGNYIEERGFAVIDGIARGRDAALLAVDHAWTAPGALGITSEPVNVTPAWATFPYKLAKSDFLLDAAKWEQVEHRGAGDWFAHSRGAAPEPLKTKAALGANAGLWVEFHAAGPPHTIIRDQAVIGFGDRYRLHVHSTGLADLEDLHPAGGGPPAYVTQSQPLVAGGGELLNRFVQIGILPWRRGRLLVWTNLGASFEAVIGERLDTSDTLAPRRTPGEAAFHVITEGAQATLDLSAARTAGGATQAPRAFGTINPLWYPPAGSLTSPVLDLPRAVTQAPASQYLQAEQQDGASATLSLTDGAGNPFAPDADHPLHRLRYRIDLAAPATRGIYTTLAPVVFGAHIDFDRQLGDRTYDTSEVGSPQSASIVLSRDRGQKSFEFTLDNPDERWTSLKDLFNRVVEAYIEADDVDPVAGVVFKGVSDPVDFLDGVASKVRVPCSGLRKRLRSHLLSDARQYDGVKDTDVFRSVLHDAGVADADMVIYDAGGVALDTAEPGEDPLWRPDNGQSADEFLQFLADTWSGWVYDDIGGKYYYVPREYFTALAIEGNPGVPEVLMETPRDDITHGPTEAARGPNPSVLVALKDSVRQSAAEPLANDIWVLGRDAKTGQILAAHYEDTDSIKNRVVGGTNNLNYVGERRLFLYASASITNLAMAQAACGRFGARLTRPVRTVTFDLADYQQARLPLEGPLLLHGYGYALITDVSGTWTSDRWRQTSYSCELI